MFYVWCLMFRPHTSHPAPKVFRRCATAPLHHYAYHKIHHGLHGFTLRIPLTLMLYVLCLMFDVSASHLTPRTVSHSSLAVRRCATAPLHRCAYHKIHHGLHGFTRRITVSLCYMFYVWCFGLTPHFLHQKSSAVAPLRHCTAAPIIKFTTDYTDLHGE